MTVGSSWSLNLGGHKFASSFCIFSLLLLAVIQTAQACTPDSDACGADKIVDTKWRHGSGSWSQTVINASDYIYPTREAAMGAMCEKYATNAPQGTRLCDNVPTLAIKGVLLQCPIDVPPESGTGSTFRYHYRWIRYYCDGSASTEEHDSPLQSVGS